MELISSGSKSPPKKRSSKPRAKIESLDRDILCTIFSSLGLFDLVRCSLVCKSWNATISRSKLLQKLYYKLQNDSRVISNTSSSSMRMYLEELAMNHHRLSLVEGRIDINQWNGHSALVDQCRMKRGLILTGVGDQVMRLWSLESYKCVEEYSIPSRVSLVDFDFDESKIVGLIGTRICIWRRNGAMSVFPPREGTFLKGLCMRYFDPEAVVGCEDGTARVFDMYSRQCSRIIRTMKPLWETRVSPNVIYSLQHLQHDASTIVVGGIDGVLRVLDQNTGEVLSSCVTDISTVSSSSENKSPAIERKRGVRLSKDTLIDRIPRSTRPPITCLAVGMKKVVTTHHNKYIRLWKFH